MRGILLRKISSRRSSSIVRRLTEQLGPIQISLVEFVRDQMIEQNDLFNNLLENEEIVKIKELQECTSLESSLRYRAGRIAAKSALQCLGVKPSFAILHDTHGAPIFPSFISGSISHKNNLALSGVIRTNVSTTTPVMIGVDIEQLGGGSERLGQRILTEKELTTLGNCNLSTRDEILLRFSLKESVYKAIFPLVQRYIPFKEVEVFPSSSSQTASVILHPSLVARGSPPLLSGYYRFYHDNKQDVNYCLTAIVCTQRQ